VLDTLFQIAYDVCMMKTNAQLIRQMTGCIRSAHSNAKMFPDNYSINDLSDIEVDLEVALAAVRLLMKGTQNEPRL
jgi:hypothetical protein